MNEPSVDALECYTCMKCYAAYLPRMLLGLGGLGDVLLGDCARQVSNAHDAHTFCLQLLNPLRLHGPAGHQLCSALRKLTHHTAEVLAR